MSLLEQKRCFECGATYPSEALVCGLDGTPLSFERIGRRWKIEGLLARRMGGGVFAAFHLISGTRAAIDVVPWPLTEDPALGGRLFAEVQALRVLEKHPGTPRLLETGTDQDGSRFVITELNAARPLRELMDEWRRPGEGLVAPARASQLLSPALSLLAMAHKAGIVHGALDASCLFLRTPPPRIAAAPGSGSGAGPAGHEILQIHGLRVHQRDTGEKEALVDLCRADLRGLALILRELLCGDVPLALGAAPPSSLGPALTSLLGRALGEDPALSFRSAEELLHALLLAAPPMVQVDMPRISIKVPALRAQGQGTSTQQTPALPLPLLPIAGGAIPKAGLTSELRQVSLLDLFTEPKPRPSQNETLAVSRSRPFTTAEMEAAPLPRSMPSSRDDTPTGEPTDEDPSEDEFSWPAIELVEQSKVQGSGASGVQSSGASRVQGKGIAEPGPPVAADRAQTPAPSAVSGGPPASFALTSEVPPTPRGSIPVHGSDVQTAPLPPELWIAAAFSPTHPITPQGGQQTASQPGGPLLKDPSHPGDRSPSSVSRHGPLLSTASNISQQGQGQYPSQISQPGQHPSQISQPGQHPSRISQSGQGQHPSRISQSDQGQHPSHISQQGHLPPRISQPGQGQHPSRISQQGHLPPHISQPGQHPSRISQSGQGRYPSHISQPGQFPSNQDPVYLAPAPSDRGLLPLLFWGLIGILVAAVLTGVVLAMMGKLGHSATPALPAASRVTSFGAGEGAVALGTLVDALARAPSR